MEAWGAQGACGGGTQAWVLTLEPDSLAASVMTSGAKSAVSRVVPPGLIPGPRKKLCLLAGSVATSPDEGSAWEFDFLIRFEAILSSSRQHRRVGIDEGPTPELQLLAC